MNWRKIRWIFNEISGNIQGFFDKYNIQGVLDKPLSERLTGVLPILGYIMFLGGIVNYLHILYPLRLQNAVWELQTLGLLVENSWGFLISLGFILTRYFDDNQIGFRYVEFFLMKLIRWLIFFMAILFILSTPLIINNTNRLVGLTRDQIDREAQTKLTEITQLESNLGQTLNENQLRLVAQSIGIPTNTLATIPTSQLKSQIQQQLTILKADIENNTQTLKREEVLKIRKNSLKTFVTGLLISFAFIIIWWNIGKVSYFF